MATISTVPVQGDVRGGIRDWADDKGDLGNNQYGDCDIAAFEQLRKCHEVAAASTVKKVLYKLGFKPPHTPYAIEVYTEYLASIGEKPGPNAGVNPGAFFAWAQTKGLIKDWGSVDISQGLDAVREAMIAHRGCILGVNLTGQADEAGAVPGGKWITGTGAQYQPNPNLSHAIALVEYDPEYFACVTWCFLVYCTPEWIEQCMWGCFWFDL